MQHTTNKHGLTIKSTVNPRMEAHLPIHVMAPPIHVMAPYMANGDLLAFQKCMILNKEFNPYTIEHKLLHFKALLIVKHPEFWNRIETHVKRMSDLKSFDLKVFLGVLDAFITIKNRKKGEKYQHLLKPLMNREIFADNAFRKGQSNEVIIKTLYIMLALAEYSSQFTSGIIDPKKWVFYATVDYSFYGIMHLQENNNAFCSTAYQIQILAKADTVHPSDYRQMPPETRYKLQRLFGDIKANLKIQ